MSVPIVPWYLERDRLHHQRIHGNVHVGEGGQERVASGELLSCE